MIRSNDPTFIARLNNQKPRAFFSNTVIDAAISRAKEHNWTRDIPASFIAEMFPFRMKDGEISNDNTGDLLIIPAEESDRGRGAPFFDVVADLDGLTVGLSLKISEESRAPRNASVAGSKAAHLFGLILAARENRVLPVLSYWRDSAGQWYRCCFDLGAVLREHGVRLTGGWNSLGDNEHAQEQLSALSSCLGYSPESAVGAPRGTVAVAVSPLKRKSGGRIRVYLNMKINHLAAGHRFSQCTGPHMPGSYGELLSWMGLGGDLIG